MFRRLSEPLPLSEASLLLLRPALNTPVLNVGYLPVGPARAAVVAFGEEYGGIGIALGVRSNESGQLAVLRNQESIDFDVPLAEALEPLLAAAERMGFLFDEDIFQVSPGANGRAQAMAHWAELMGTMEGLLPARSADVDASRSSDDDDDRAAGPLSPSLAVAEMQYPELMLDDVAPFVLGEDDLSFAPGSDDTLGETLETDLEDDFEDVLDDELEDDLEGESDDSRRGDSVLDESDLTEPTTPILAAKAAEKASPLATPPEPISAPVAAPRARAPLPPPPFEPERPIHARPATPPAPSLPEIPPTMPRVVLSKFRNIEGTPVGGRETGAKSEVGADRSAELARIPIVRVRREREAVKRVPFLARLLSSF